MPVKHPLGFAVHSHLDRSWHRLRQLPAPDGPIRPGLIAALRLAARIAAAQPA